MEIFGLGVTVIDLIAIVERYPAVDTKQDVQCSVMQVGGPVPTALAQLKRFGWSCRLLSAWGDDPLGDMVERHLRETGIAYSPEVRQGDVATGFSQVWVERQSGRRTSVTQRPAIDNDWWQARLPVQLAGCRVLHLDGWPTEVSLAAAQLVKASGGHVSIDTGSRKPGIEHLLQLADVVNAPRRFMQEFLNESDPARGAAALGALGPRCVTVTDGARGAWLWSEGSVIHQPAILNEAVVDTNGAGDVFAAAMLHALLSDWPCELALSFAVAAAGLKCTGLGNRDALPALADVSRLVDFSELPKKPAPAP